jgi:YniB-like protein
MNYFTARREVIIKRLTGLPLTLVAFLLFALGTLKFLYGSLDNAHPAFFKVATGLKLIVSAIYEHSQLIEPLWRIAPVPDPKILLSSQSVAWFLCCMAGFLGASLLRSASRLAQRLRDADRAIEDELMRESLRAKQPRTREQLKEQAQVPKQSVWKEIHTLYIAPLIVLLIGAVLLKLLGLT